MKTLDEFEQYYYGKSVPNNHNQFKGECVSLAARWAQEGQNVPNGDQTLYCAYTDGARDLYESYGKPGMYIQNYYDKVPSPIDGDLVVWGANMGQYGDVAIYSGAGQVFGQLGTPVFQPAAARQMTPTPLGYLRRKGTNVEPKYNDGDAQNLNSWLYHEDKGRFRQYIEQDYKEAIGNVFLSPEYNVDAFINAGDLENIFPILVGHPPTQADKDAWIGRTWKQFVYDKILREVAELRKQLDAKYKPYSGEQLFTEVK